MEEYIRKFKHYKRGSHGHHSYRGHGQMPEGFARPLKKAKRILIVVVVMGILVAVSLVILAIAALNWLFDRGGDAAKQATESATQQVQQQAPALDLASYVDGTQVQTDKLTQVYNALPAPVQDAWLGDLKSQIDELKSQAGVANETVQSLTVLYETLLKQQ